MFETMRKAIVIIAVLSTFAQAAFAQKDAAYKAYRNENFRTAANLFKTVVTQEPTAENFNYLGNSLSRVGIYDSARMAYEQAIKVDPKYGPGYAGIARTFLSQNNTTKALEYFSMAKSTTNANKDVSYYTWLADAYINNAASNPQEAVNQLNKAK